MSYNTKRRRAFTSKQRAEFLISHGATCYWCKQTIKPGEPWDIEHMIARELLHADDDPDGDWNLAPIHSHPAKCHKEKTAQDRKIIAKSNRIRRKNGPKELRKKTLPIKSRGFQPGQRKLQSRSKFQKRRDK